MKRWLREPLLHFAACGALLFAAYAWLHPGAPAGGEIRVGAGEIKWLAATWRGQTGREPTPAELDELLANLVKEELLAREAREMRLDENDTIVRRRLAQKLEFLIQDTARLAEPSDQELRRFYEASPQVFLTQPRVSFTHKLIGQHAQPKLLESEFRDADPATVAALFGPQFARAVFELQPGGWQGPIESGYGAHLVRVAGVQPARARDFEEVRLLVLERWREQQSRAAEQRYVERLKEKYRVVIEK